MNLDKVLEVENGGKYTDFYSFCKRVYSKEFNRRVVESLIKSGALDGLDMNRRQMIHMLPKIIKKPEPLRAVLLPF